MEALLNLNSGKASFEAKEKLVPEVSFGFPFGKFTHLMPNILKKCQEDEGLTLSSI